MTLTDEARIKLQRDTVAQHMAGENEHNWDKVYDTFIQDERAWYDVMPFATRYSGFSGVQDFYAAFEAAVPDFTLRVTHEYDVPTCSIREVTLTGTHQGEFMGIAPQGRPISFELAAFYLFGDGDEAGKLLAERVYFDTETVLRQMRGDDGPVGVGLAEEAGAQ